MKILNQIENICYNIPIQCNIDIALLDLDNLFYQLGITEDYIEKNRTINLSHLPELKNEDRWKKYSGNHFTVSNDNKREGDFVKFLDELTGSYLKEIIDKIYDYHLKKFDAPFAGRAQLITLPPGVCYTLHRDLHTKHRYHIPLKTHKDIVWMFKNDNEDPKLLHMPADGNIWYLDPITIKHTVMNMSPIHRWHILLTSEK